MIGDKWPSEMRTYADPKSGQTVTQLTDRGVNVHMYFTDNSFDNDNEHIYFLSNRLNPDQYKFQVFYMDLKTGEMEQITDEPAGVQRGSLTKSRDGQYLAYVTAGTVIRLYNTRTREFSVLYEEKGNYRLHKVFFNCDNTKAGFLRNEKVEAPETGGPNYLGFKDRMYQVKDGRVCSVNLDGTGYREVFRDTHQVNHFQYSPDDPAIASYCHEGPWNLVHQRIWIINMETGEVWPCFRQGETDCVGHEFWSEQGDLVFDNRRGGHDGTISSSKEQVFAVEAVTTETPYFGFAHKDGKVYRTIEMPFYCNHYHANADCSLFVGDAIEDVVLIKPLPDGQSELHVLANHNTTWKYQHSHPHPTFAWDGSKVLYAADTDDWHGNLFIVGVPEELRK